MKKYVIIPGCSDLNRGDQALVWETMELVKDMGEKGEFYLLASNEEPVQQSEKEGLKIIPLILEHPARFTKNRNNIQYGLWIKIKWGGVAIIDWLSSIMYLNKFTRNIIKRFISEEKRNCLQVLEEADKIFVKGGGFIHAYGGVTAPYFVYFAIYHIKLALSLGKDVYILPNSFGPFEGTNVKRMIRKTLNKCKFVSTREGISKQAVKKELGIDIPVFPDLAYYLKPSKLDEKLILEKFELPTDKKLVAITMRPYRFPKSENPKQSYEIFKQEMASFIKWLSKEGFMPVIIEHTLAVNKHEDDGACIKDVVAQLDKNEYRIIHDVSYNCRDLKAIYSMCDYIIGTRFHSVIFSVASGLPGIAITYGGNKGRGIMREMDLEYLSIGIEELNCKLLKNKFKYIIENEEEVKDKILKYVEFSKGKREELIQILKSL